ncbi:hypothetical protein [Caudoviricetes sp.]|nr:hypothetical protein [Caudoviricetes sp.]
MWIFLIRMGRVFLIIAPFFHTGYKMIRNIIIVLRNKNK